MITAENNGTLKSRLAPTPSGFLHPGNLSSFVRTWLAVRKRRGQLLLRIDDLDNDRSRPAYLQDIFNWLQLLGINYDAGPKSVEDFTGNWSQQLRLPIYQKLLQQLLNTGLVYACTCSRKMIAANSPGGIYNGTCRHKKIALDTPDAVWRLHIPATTMVSWNDELMGHLHLSPATLMGDFVIRKKNGLPSYQVASLADDIHFGINYIVRGKDLVASTTAQLYLASLIDAHSFLQTQFCHHPLMLDEAGNKLSKSAGAEVLHHHHPQPKDAANLWPILMEQCGMADTGKMISTVADLLESGS